MGLFLPGNRTRVVFDIELAEKLGLNAAIILSRIIWSIEMKIENGDTDYFKDGCWWMYDSISSLSKYSTLGRDAIKRTISHLRDLRIINSKQYNLASGQAENWYMVDGNILAEILALPPIGAKPTSGGDRCKTNQWVGAKPTSGVGAKPTNLSISLIAKSHTKNSNPVFLAEVTPLKTPKKREKKIKAIEYNADDFEIAARWLAYAEREMPWKKGTPKWNVEIFSEGLFKVREYANLNFFGLEALLKYVSNGWWASKACSPMELLKITDKESGRRKIDTILSQMKPDSMRQEEKMKSWAPATEAELNNPFG